jgi:DeoR family glycerol-3-phosphate regulon repressor
VVVLADHTKWGTLGISTIASLEDADELISDDLLGGEARRILGERVGRLRLASTGGAPRGAAPVPATAPDHSHGTVQGAPARGAASG